MSTDLVKFDAVEASIIQRLAKSIGEDEAVLRAVDAAEYAMSIVVTDEASRKEAESSVLDIARGLKKVEADRKPITQGIDGLKKAVMDYVKGVSGPLLEADKYLGTQLTRYMAQAAARAERARIEREAAVAAAAAAGAPPPIVRSEPAPLKSTPNEDGSGVTTKWDLKVELERPGEAPEHLLILSPGAIAWMKDQLAGGHADLPKKDGATILHRGIRATWVMGIQRRTGA